MLIARGGKQRFMDGWLNRFHMPVQDLATPRWAFLVEPQL
jgi:hypothetical protein